MSPKNNSLAYEDLAEETLVERESFTPELNLIITKRMHLNQVQPVSSNHTISIRGSITVSF